MQGARKNLWKKAVNESFKSRKIGRPKTAWMDTATVGPGLKLEDAMRKVNNESEWRSTIYAAHPQSDDGYDENSGAYVLSGDSVDLRTLPAS